MKRLMFVSMFFALALVIVGCAAPTAAPAPAATSAPAASGGQTYTFAQGDTLADLAQKNLGNKDWSWAIYGLNNAKHLQDSSFAQITNPDQIATGSKIYIPTKDEAQAFMSKFDPKNPDLKLLFPKPTGGQMIAGNWWTSAGEFAAINAVYDLYRKQYPGVEIVHAGVAGGGGVNFQAAILPKLQGGDPYDVFQTHAGLEVVQYDPEKYLQPLDDIVNQGEGDVLPQQVKDLLTYKGHIYTVPMNIHHGNVLWINKKVFADNNLTPPTTVDDFFKVADALKAKGIIPLAMGGAEGFEQPQTFETTLIATVGGEGLKDLWSGKMSWKDPKVADALNLYKKYLTYTNSDRDALSWDQATKLVINGQAAMNIMGDWADGEFIAAHKTSADYEGIPAPGNKGVFLLVSDAFALPKQSANHDNAVNFLKLITTKEAQEAFNIRKGSICARTDCDYSNFDDYLKSSAAEFKTDIIVPCATHGSAIVAPWKSAFYDILKKFTADGDVAAAQSALVQAAIDNGVPQ